MLIRALSQKTLPVYGDGLQVRDWIHVHDFCRALRLILAKAEAGNIFNVSAGHEMTNLDFIKSLTSELDRQRPGRIIPTYADLIVHVHDRPGHDRRYALNAEKLRKTLGWQAEISFTQGLSDTVQWYLKQIQN